MKPLQIIIYENIAGILGINLLDQRPFLQMRIWKKQTTFAQKV